MAHPKTKKERILAEQKKKRRMCENATWNTTERAVWIDSHAAQIQRRHGKYLEAMSTNRKWEKIKSGCFIKSNRRFSSESQYWKKAANKSVRRNIEEMSRGANYKKEFDIKWKIL